MQMGCCPIEGPVDACRAGMLVIDVDALVEELLPSLVRRSHALTSSVNGTNTSVASTGIAFGRGRHPASVRSLNYWRHLVAYLAIAGSLAYATDDWDLDRGDPNALSDQITAVLERLEADGFADSFKGVFKQQIVPEDELAELIEFLKSYSHSPQ